MSQPLTGQVRRRLKELSIPEGWLLMALADMVDAQTRQWREPWACLALRLGRKHQWRIRQAAYRLRDKNWLTIQSDGRSVLITLTLERGFSSAQVATLGSNQVATKCGDQIATHGGEQVATKCSAIDSPPYDPPGGNAPKRPHSRGGRIEIRKGEQKGNARSLPPPSPGNAPEGNGTPSPHTLSPAGRISAEKELGHHEREVEEIKDRYDSSDDWDPKDRQRLKTLRIRIAELKLCLGWKA